MQVEIAGVQRIGKYPREDFRIDPTLCRQRIPVYVLEAACERPFRFQVISNRRRRHRTESIVEAVDAGASCRNRIPCEVVIPVLGHQGVECVIAGHRCGGQQQGRRGDQRERHRVTHGIPRPPPGTATAFVYRV